MDTGDPLFRLQLHQPGLLRPLVAELSDGTLRYLLLPLARLIFAVPETQRCSVWRLE